MRGGRRRRVLLDDDPRRHGLRERRHRRQGERGRSTTGTTPAAATAAPEPKVNVERASGPFRSLAHETTGTAAIVDLADGGRRLTLTDLRDRQRPRPVRLPRPRARRIPTASVDGGVSLGRLKGNIGTQQYDVPADVDIAGGASVVIWCRAFTVAFGAAQLQRS